MSCRRGTGYPEGAPARPRQENGAAAPKGTVVLRHTRTGLRQQAKRRMAVENIARGKDCGVGISPGTIRKLLEAYHERFGIILPTAGTVLNIGPYAYHRGTPASA